MTKKDLTELEEAHRLGLITKEELLRLKETRAIQELEMFLKNKKVKK